MEKVGSQSNEVVRLNSTKGRYYEIENFHDSTDLSELSDLKQRCQGFKYERKGKTVAVTPFRVEAQERIRRLGYNVEVSKRLRNADLFSSYARFDSTMVTTRRKKNVFRYKEEDAGADMYRRVRLSSDFAQPADDTVISAENSSVVSIDSPFAPSPLNEKAISDDDSRTLDNSFDTTIRRLSRGHIRPTNLESSASHTDSREIVKRTKTARHPLYGELLADVGYKRIYLSSAKQVISSIPIWHLQRPTDFSRVAEIARAKARKLVFPGCISVFEFVHIDRPRFEVPQTFGIFDGQHRVHAAAKILQENNEISDFKLTLEVFPVQHNDDVKELFLELNKAERVQEIDLPDAIAPFDKQIINSAVMALNRKYEQMFKASKQCRKPHVNRDILRNEIHKNKIIARYNVGNASEMIELLERINLYVGSVVLCRKEGNEKLRSLNVSCTARAKSKATKYMFYLGLTDDWLHEDLNLILS